MSQLNHKITSNLFFKGLLCLIFFAVQLEIIGQQPPTISTPAKNKKEEAEKVLAEGYKLIDLGTEKAWREALEKFSAARRLFNELQDKAQEAAALQALGFISDGLGEKTKAHEYFTQSLPLCESAKDVQCSVSALLSLGKLSADAGEVQNGLQYYQRSLKLSKDAKLQKEEAVILNNIAFIFDDLGEKSEAANYYTQALGIHRAIGNKQGEADTLSNLGVLYNSLGDKKKALEMYQQALPLAKEIGDARGEAITLNNLARTFNDLGERDKAIKIYNEALALHRKMGNKQGEAYTLINIGAIYKTLNDKQKSLQQYELALPIIKSIGDINAQAVLLNNLGTIYDNSGENQKALDYYNQGLSLAKSTGNKGQEAGLLSNIGFNYFRTGEKPKALQYFNDSLLLYQKIGDKRGEALSINNIGLVYENLGDYPKASLLYNQALPISKVIENRDYEAATLSNLMSVWEKTGNRNLAILYGKQAVNIYQGLRKDIRELDKGLQKSFLGSIEHVYRKLAELLIKAGRLPEAEQVLAMLKEEEYFEFVRRDGDLAKALDKRISLSPSEKEALETYDKIAGEITALGVEFDKLEAEKNNRATSDARRKEILARQDELDKKLEVARVALNKFLEALKDEFGKNDSRVAAVESGLQKDVERLKEPQTVVISTIVGKENLSLIVTTARAQTAHVIPISEENLNLLVAEFRAALMDSRSEKWREPAQKLYDFLIKPLQKDLDGVRARTLVWSLDGMLRYAPIAALWDNEKGYLIQRYANAVITLASRSDLAQRADGKNRWQALGVGVSKPFAGFSALSYVPEELNGIVRDATVQTKVKQSGVLNGRRLLDEDFTFDNFRLYLGRYPVVHAATHFSFIPGTRAEALESFLLLGNGERLTLGQMQKSGTIFSGVELLALSACDTAYGGKDADGREIENFGALAQNKGARSVLASLWRVADASTRDLIINFYANYQKPNLSKADALRQSQLALLEEPDKTAIRKQVKNGTKKYAHPFYWSPFVLIGNWH